MLTHPTGSLFFSLLQQLADLHDLLSLDDIVLFRMLAKRKVRGNMGNGQTLGEEPSADLLSLNAAPVSIYFTHPF